MSNKSFFVISLDFELLWGMFDKVTIAEYGENILGAHAAIPELLSVFTQNGIHATWAAVGLLLCENKAQLRSLVPQVHLQPHYKDMRLSSYYHITHSTLGENKNDDPYHYGADLARMIIYTPHQEFGSHTFSHYYCLDGSENGKAIFAADCEAFKKASAPFGVGATSIVFPRNQTTREALEVCAEAGFTAYRGTPDHFLYTSKKEKAQTNPLLRMMRLIDAYINISGHHTFTLENMREHILVNVRGSRFLRPYSTTLRTLEKLRIQRIKNSMTYAAKHGEVFHLWWHPHNFGINRKENMQNLLSILEHFAYLKETYGMESITMGEAATFARSNN